MDDLVVVMVERESWTTELSGITGGQLVMWEETLECRWTSGGDCARYWYWKESSHESLLMCQ